MSELLHDRKVFSLIEVTRSIQKTLDERYKSAFWVKAEMNKLNLYKQSGHCFPELVEKQDGKILAQINSIIWKDDFLRINQAFTNTLKEPLKDGIKILFLANVSYDPKYGLTLQILDIDPSFTLGDLEKEKQETILRMKQEGIYQQNKTRVFPLLPQRIAIISVESSKGYIDFLRIIDNNAWNYKFFHLLFPSLLQGDKSTDGIIFQLQQIRKVINHFDVVAIIRGGGADIGMSSYNNYRLAREIALFPIPVITGIGHATNETVSELTSFYNAITPTKLGEYLIQRVHDFSVPVQKCREQIAEKSKRLIRDEKNRFQSEVKLFRSVTDRLLVKNKQDVRSLSESLIRQSRFRFRQETIGLFSVKNNMVKDLQTIWQQQRLALTHAEKNIEVMDPKNVLKRGFSITMLNGKAVKNTEHVKKGDQLKTIIFGGTIESIVESTNKPAAS